MLVDQTNHLLPKIIVLLYVGSFVVFVKCNSAFGLICVVALIAVRFQKRHHPANESIRGDFFLTASNMARSNQ